MSELSQRKKTCGDPRMLADFIALREEMSKLVHPARPDVSWQRVERLCMAIFEHNGFDLQTGAWYTLARAQQAGVAGMNEGLKLVEALILRQWDNLWPQAPRARMDILCALSRRLHQVMRTLTPTTTDPGQLYLAQTHLTAIAAKVERLDLKHDGELDTLRSLIQSAALRLESGKQPLKPEPKVPVGAVSACETPEPPERSVFVPPAPLPESGRMKQSPAPARPWTLFIAGVLTALVPGVAMWGWQALHQPEPDLLAFPAKEYQALQQQLPEPGIRQTQQRLTRLAQLKPDWVVSYGDTLLGEAQKRWPKQAQPLTQQWHQQLTAVALPPEYMRGWHQGMMELQQLIDRLNALDEQKGKYITVSELKTAVFAMTQSFNSAIPAEEELRKLSEIPQGQPWPTAQQTRMEQHLQQLIVRYALLKPRRDE